MIHNIGFGPVLLKLNIPSWSISIEFWVNFLMYSSVLLIGLPSSRLLRLFCLSVALVGLTIIELTFGTLNVNLYDYGGVLNSGLVRCISSFALGILTYEFYKWRSLSGNPRKSLLLGAAAATIFLLSLLSPWKQSPPQIGFPFAFCFVIYIFSIDQSLISKAISRLSYIGEISFSIYLLHWPILLLFRQASDRFDFWKAYHAPASLQIALSCGFLLFVFVASHLSYRYFEVPVYRFLRTLAPARNSAATAERDGR